MTYSIIETAKILSVNRQTIYMWIKNNKIKYIIKNGKKRIEESELNRIKTSGNYGDSEWL